MTELIYNGVNLSTYCDYIYPTNSNASPERVYESIEVPGRSGNLIIDKGYFKNVQREYSVIVTEDPESRYTDLLSFFGTVTGYEILEDSDEPDIYMMAKISTVTNPIYTTEKNALKFTIVFERKPQKYLKEGDKTVEVRSSWSLVNPTKFPSSPLIQFVGKGYSIINGSVVHILPGTLGNIDVTDGYFQYPYDTWKRNYLENFNQGDIITVGEVKAELSFSPLTSLGTMKSVTYDVRGGELGDIYPSSYSVTFKDNIGYAEFTVPQHQRVLNTTVYGERWSCGLVIHVVTDVTEFSFTFYVIEDLDFYGNSHYIIIRPTVDTSDLAGGYTSTYAYISGISGESTVDVGDVYVDMETGNSYTYFNEKQIPVNHLVSLESTLPTLIPGDNDIRTSNSLNKLFIKPRWWRL